MSFFGKKINPFSSFTISLGPLYVERVFDSVLTLQGVPNMVRMPGRERFERYLDYLRKETDIGDHERYTIIQFYKAHFWQQLAGYAPQAEDTRHCQEKALCYYQNYLDLSIRQDESTFYAQWQAGALQDLLKYPWSLVEESLLKALTHDPLRGEPLKILIDHYIRNKEWKIAYSYSSLAVKKHFDKNPAGSRRWFVEFDAYNWKVANKHCTICYKLGYLPEAEEIYQRLIKYELHHTDEFQPAEIRHIHYLAKIFHTPKPRLATAS